MDVVAGSTDVTTYVVLRLAADGTEATGLTIADIDLQYCRSGATPAAKVDATALAATNTAHTDNYAIEIDATDQPGLYRVDWPDAAFAAGVREVILSVKESTCFTEHIRVNLTPVPANVQSMATGVIAAATFAAGAIDATAVADGAIDAATLATGTITAAKFAAGAIDASAIATDAITAAKIAADALTSSELATSAVNEIVAAASATLALGIPSMNLPPNVQSIGKEQVTSLSSAAGLASIATGARYAVIDCEGAEVRFWGDGSTPTAAVGRRLLAGGREVFFGNLAALKFIETTTSAKLNVEYFR